jgi:hypothetical protein
MVFCCFMVVVFLRACLLFVGYFYGFIDQKVYKDLYHKNMVG